MKKVLITGATGLIGQTIVNACHNNDIAVNYLTTSPTKLENRSNYQGFLWNPGTGDIDVGCFDGVSVIINLAGAPIAQRWTRSAKNEIINSRTKTLRLLYETIRHHDIKIEQLISASAIGYYPPSYTQYYEENHTNEDQSFIIDVVRQWELEADAFKSLNISVSKIRIGLVLANNGGALPQLSQPIKYFAGACVGTGKQWQSWIHIDDVCRIFMFVMTDKLDGVFNAVAPNPVTHKVMMKQIAKSLNRPILLPNIPENIMRLILGEMHVVVTKGARVSSKKIENLGFIFEHYQIESAIEDLIQQE